MENGATPITNLRKKGKEKKKESKKPKSFKKLLE